MKSRASIVGLAIAAVLVGAGCRKKAYLPDLATEKLKVLAKQGNAEAAHQLGMRYEGGHRVSKNEAEAVGWYKMAAGRGFIPSQFNLGLCYEESKGIDQDKTKAKEWYAKVASYSGDSKEYQFFADQAESHLEDME